MKEKLFLLLFLCSISNIYPQQNDCESILSKKINSNFNDTKATEEFRNNLLKLVGCGIDSIDLTIFSNGPIAATFLMDIVSENNNGSELTYRHFFDKILDFKKTEQYQKLRNINEASIALEKRPANINNWEEDKLLLQQLEMPEQYISEFYIFLKNNNQTFNSYKEAIISFSESIKEVNTVSNVELTDIFNNPGNVDFNELSTLSIENKKPILLYFTGYACVNCRKMEDNIFKMKPIFDVLKNNFLVINLYVDDRTQLPEKEWFNSKVYSKTIKTIGQKNSEYQITKFQSNTQPLFVILNSDGQVLEKFQYTKSSQDFLDFLDRGLSKL